MLKTLRSNARLVTFLQAGLLAAAIVTTGAALKPTQVQAVDEPCSQCNGGRIFCDSYLDPVTGQLVRCKQTIDCI